MDRRRRWRRPTFVTAYNDITAVSFTIDRCHPNEYPSDIIRLSILLCTPDNSTKCGPARSIITRVTTRRFLRVCIPVFYYFSGSFFISASHRDAKCDRPFDLLAARNYQGSLYSGLTSYKNVTTLYSLQLAALTGLLVENGKNPAKGGRTCREILRMCATDLLLFADW